MLAILKIGIAEKEWSANFLQIFTRNGIYVSMPKESTQTKLKAKFHHIRGIYSQYDGITTTQYFYEALLLENHLLQTKYNTLLFTLLAHNIIENIKALTTII